MATVEYELLRQPSKEHSAILSLILSSIEDSPWKNKQINLPHLKLIVSTFLEQIDLDRRVVILAREGAEIVGIIAGGIIQEALVGTSMANELIWYVKPSHRKRNVAKNLLEMFERWADNNQVQYVTLSHYNNTLGDTVSILYEKRGFEKMEVSYIKEL